MNEYLKAKLSNLPMEPGCYLMKDKDETIIYVGKAKKLKNRVNQYFTGAHDFKTTKMVSNIHDFDFIVTSSEKEALVLEINLIKKHRPRFNIMFMDDSSYPYIKLTRDSAPTLSVVRDAKKDKKSRYFGPFPDASAAHSTLKLLLKLYPLRRCKKMENKVCLYYHMHQCLGPCEYEIDPSVYEEMSNSIVRFLNGDTKDIIKELVVKRDEASEHLNFEKAMEYHELIQSIEHISDKQKIQTDKSDNLDVFGYYEDKGYLAIQGLLVRRGTILGKEFKLMPLYGDAEEEFISFILQYYSNHPEAKELVLPLNVDISLVEEILNFKVMQPFKGYRKQLMEMAENNARTQLSLQFDIEENQDKKTEESVALFSKLLGKEIHRVELFDNSHISGQYTVAACVVYVDGLPRKSDYRLFKLHTGNSDVDSMKEVMYRRYFRLMSEEKVMPDCIIVDGGWTQICAAKEILDSLGLDITLCGLVKDDHHSTNALMDKEGNLIEIDRNGNLFFLLTRMQDEVHRVAISYHRKLREKAQTKSILDEIEGIGPKRKKELLKVFKSFKGIKEASVEQLCEVVPRKVAEELYEAIHSDVL
ncbi:MAG: excinuclease ABC subunit UvrC [Erysipelotrichaceae bacterium]|nr:excinuclease ABC subunit UvrC [Erysipelotrichaceae bacterium]